MAFIDEDGNWISKPITGGGAVYAPDPGAIGAGNPPPTNPYTPTPAPGTTFAPPAYGGPGNVPVGGHTPNYAELIRSSPAYLAWLASKTGRLGAAGASRAEALRNLIRQFGAVPGAFQDKYGDLRPEDILAGNENPFSQQKLIQRDYEKGVEAMRRALAARGALRSGELSYGQGEMDYQRGQAEANATDQFLTAMQQALAGYSEYEGNVLAEEAPLLAGLAPQIAEQYKPTPAQPATFIPNSLAEYGAAMYQAPDGSLWELDANGNPVPSTRQKLPKNDNRTLSQVVSGLLSRSR